MLYISTLNYKLEVMNNRLILTTLFLSFSYLVLAQSLPSTADVVKSVKKIQKIYLDENDIEFIDRTIDESKIRFIKDKFTANKRVECIAIVPMQSGSYYSEWILLFYENSGYWQYGKWYSREQNKIELIDVDNDGIKEIKVELNHMAQGSCIRKLSIISIKDGISNILYKNETFNYDCGAVFYSQKTGDEMSKEIEVSLIDVNGDGISELEEFEVVGIVQSYDRDNQPVLKYSKKKNMVISKN